MRAARQLSLVRARRGPAAVAALLCATALAGCGADAEPDDGVDTAADATTTDATDAGDDASPDDAAPGDEGSGAPDDASADVDAGPRPTPLPGVFVQPVLECRPPLPGEPASASGDEICTWSAISACTEEGRRFADYASCEDVITQRPAFGTPARAPDVEGDPRLDDPVYMEELAWVTEQVEACACTCCHSERDAPRGATGWYIEAGPLWIDTVPDAGLAMLAGLVDSEAFGAYPPEQNFGFDRATTGLPTTDIPRMQTFLIEEYLRRGRTEEEAAEFPPFGGPLVTQAAFEPQPCTRSGGIVDGEIRWTGGQARYIYVLRAGSDNPGVPPNRDLPDGTIWRLDMPSSERGLTSGVRYGDVPANAVQRWPVDGPPPALTPGEQVYVYVLADVGLPVLRCLATP
mgnify:CR=1 FL=1